jgi:5-methylcytosine-specific restriction endonuclease McrA
MKKLTSIHKQRISEAHKKGSYFECIICDSKFWRRPSDIKKGNNKFCSKKCYFKWQKGKKKIIKNQIDKSGKNNPNWRGGITPINFKIRNSKKLKEWRLKVFKRDNWTCQECGKRSKKNHYLRIEAHHIKPFASFPELRFKIDNGLTLCKKCHNKKPKGKEIWNIR